MPRIPRGELHGHAFHVLNRGNNRATVFHKDADFGAFIRLLRLAKDRTPLSLLSFTLMPNHFHAVALPDSVETLSRFMQHWLTSHVRRYHRHHGTSGHVWQDRFKSFPIENDEHMLTVIRYVLMNPVRGGLVQHPKEWPWSSLSFPDLIDPWPMPQPNDWGDILQLPLDEQTLEAVRTSVRRQAPFGAPEWRAAVAKLAGLESTLRPRGRPRRSKP